MSDFIRSDVAIMLAVMTAITVFMRVGGFWLMRYVTVTPRLRSVMNALPGCIIIALVAPAVVQGGLVTIVAVAAAMLAMVIVRSDFAAVIAGAGVAALLRAAGMV